MYGYNNSPYLLTKILLKTVASTIYNKMVSASHAKYTGGREAKPIDAPNPVNGITVNAAIPVSVSSIRGRDARLWINGILGVRSI